MATTNRSAASAAPSSRGQAMVEFALVTPMLIAMFAVGLSLMILMVDAGDLHHWTREAAIAAASQPNPPDRCPQAQSTIDRIAGQHIEITDCSANGQIVEVTAFKDFGLTFAPFPLTVTERAAVR